MSGGTLIAKFSRNERPKCVDCDREMWLLKIKPAMQGVELRDYECSCGTSKTLLVKPPWKDLTADLRDDAEA